MHRHNILTTEGVAGMSYHTLSIHETCVSLIVSSTMFFFVCHFLFRKVKLVSDKHAYSKWHSIYLLHGMTE